MKKTVSGFMLTLLVLGTLALAFRIQSAEALATIHIRTDGSIEPSSVPIQRSGNIYLLVGEVGDSIVVEKDNITIDGAGYTVRGAGTWAGIDLNGRNNVTIRNVVITGFRYGIDLDDSFNNSVFGNSLTGNLEDGISLSGSSYNSIFSNNVTENGEDGIGLVSSSTYNTVYGNDVTGNDFDGIAVGDSSDNTIYGNNVQGNDEDGIDLYGSSHNVVFGNSMTGNFFDGIDIGYSSNSNLIFKNYIVGNDDDGIDLSNSSYNSICGNNIVESYYGAIEVGYSSNYNRIHENNLTDNYYGIHLAGSIGNLFYYNNFVNNSRQVYLSESGYANVWDEGYPFGGNYWSNYTGVDHYGGPDQNQLGSDGIGDTFHGIDADNIDRYPLMLSISVFYSGIWDGKAHTIDVVSNSTVTSFSFDPEEGPFIRFNVSCGSEEIAFCKVTIPLDLLWVEDGWAIWVDDELIGHEALSSESYTHIYFVYNHSAQTVVIQGTHVLREIPSVTIILVLMSSAMLAFVFKKRKMF